MTLSPTQISASLTDALEQRLDRLDAIVSAPGRTFDLELQMTAVKLMAETIIDLGVLAPAVIETEVGTLIKKQIQAVLTAPDRAALVAGVRHFYAWASGALLIAGAVAQYRSSDG